jgi:hypothetical protein
VNVRIRDIALQMRMLDSDSMLTPAVVERIALAVAEYLRAERGDEGSRRRDTHIGESCGGGCGSHDEDMA